MLDACHSNFVREHTSTNKTTENNNVSIENLDGCNLASQKMEQELQGLAEDAQQRLFDVGGMRRNQSTAATG